MAERLSTDITRFLPLTDLAFNVLVALTGEELHGYALIKELRQRIGREGLRTGTVYAALARLQEDGLVTETEGSSGSATDERRRYYTITAMGLAVARAEAQRLNDVLALATEKRLVGDEA